MPARSGEQFRIIVRLADEAVNRVACAARRGVEFADLVELAATLELDDIVGLAEKHPELRTRSRRLLDNVSVGELLDLEGRAARNGWPLRDSLTGYWVIDTRQYERRSQLWRDISEPGTSRRLRRSSPSMEMTRRSVFKPMRFQRGLPESYEPGFAVRPLAQDERARKAAAPCSREQGFLEAAPQGIDARCAWGLGFRGQGIRFVDLEVTWNFQHRGLRNVRWMKSERGDRALLYNDNAAVTGDGDCPLHGTNVLGVVVGSDEERHISGVAPEVTGVGTVSFYRRASGETALPEQFDVAGAIVEAVRNLAEGDVLLLEVETRVSALPIEVVPHCFDAIRLAVGNGIIVVEAAGNGGHNLDGSSEGFPDWHPSIVLNRSDPLFTDSGAIMVSASLAECTEDGHAPATRDKTNGVEPNYGSRVDCYAWGERVRTLGGAEASSPDCNQRTTDEFEGTSSASAIVAGAAILTQQMHVRAKHRILCPAELRWLLSDPDCGTPCLPLDDDVFRWIGTMPDLKAIAARLELIREGALDLETVERPAPGEPMPTP
jgi:serine protease